MSPIHCLFAVAVTLALLSGCSKRDPAPVFSGRVEQFYYLDAKDAVFGFTRLDKGMPGTSTMLKEDVYVEVRQDWVVVKLLNRQGSSYIVPRERVRSIVVGTKEGNELNIPK